MNSDSAFYIGKTHAVCQDYATHGFSCHNLPYAIVSDGCSSSPDTDFGSRLLTKACASLFESEGYFDSKLILQRVAEQSEMLGLPDTALDATLLTVQKIPNSPGSDVYSIACSGDGVIVKLKNNGRVDVTQIEYVSGAPFYLSYQLSKERTQLFKEKFGLKRVVNNYSLFDGKIINVKRTEDETGLVYFDEECVRDYIALAVMSDGALSFMETVRTDTSKISVPVQLNRVLKEILSFKNYNSVFVQRRLQRFRKDCEERSWFSTDDVSLGAIYLGE